jgi:Planctomycete cytochrome C
VTCRIATLVGCLFLLAGSVGAAERTGPVDFARDVRPILANNCFACHGPDAKARKAGLRIDLRAEAVKPGKTGIAPLVPGKAAASELVRRLVTDVGDLSPSVSCSA